MIYTCTLNPSVDYVMELANVEIGDLNRAKNTEIYPGGKGINVSRVLKRLGVSSTTLGFVGGFTGDFIIQSLKKEEISQDFITVKEPTRINVKLKSGAETEINGEGSSITQNDEIRLLEKIALLNANDYLILAGSVPPNCSKSLFQKIATEVNKTGAKLIIDTSGEALKEVIKCKPFLIKPNQHELGELFQVEISSVKEAVIFGRKLIKEGPENVIVSLGEKGALLLTKEFTAFANVPKGQLKNSVGAGDSMVAGFTASFIQQKDILMAFRYGIAAGSATAFSSDLCDKESLEKLISEIHIEIINEEERS